MENHIQGEKREIFAESSCLVRILTKNNSYLLNFFLFQAAKNPNFVLKSCYLFLYCTLNFSCSPEMPEVPHYLGFSLACL